jgi:hypothetical protein
LQNTDNDIHIRHQSVIEFLNVESETPTHIHKMLKDMQGEKVDVSTVGQSVHCCIKTEG